MDYGPAVFIFTAFAAKGQVPWTVTGTNFLGQYIVPENITVNNIIVNILLFYATVIIILFNHASTSFQIEMDVKLLRISNSGLEIW